MPDLWLANDHAAFPLKTALIDWTHSFGWTVRDLGAKADERADYPDQANRLAVAYNGQGGDLGLLICGSGIGVSIAANRHPHLRAALCWDATSAALCRRHNDANVLCLGARLIGVETAKAALEAFLTVSFEGGRHRQRVMKLAS